MIFFAQKKNGALKFEAPTKFKEYIAGLPDCRVSVVMKRYRKPRSIPQNSLFHALCQIIADETGHTLDEVKGGIKVELGLYAQKDGMTLLISSANLNTLEFNKLIEKTYEIAARLSIVLPTPEEWDEMKNV